MWRFVLCAFATFASLLASAATATNTSAINTTGMGHWTRPTIEGLVERTDYTERHVLYGVYNGTAWTELDFEQRPGTYAVAEVLRNPHAEHRWELIKITSLNDTDAFYTAGYAEALATHVGIYNFWFNSLKVLQPKDDNPNMPMIKELIPFLRNYPHQDTAYGRMVPQMMRQIDGMWAGWEAAYRATGSPDDMADFTWFSVFFMTYHEDYINLPKPPGEEDLEAVVGDAPRIPTKGPRLGRTSHCTSAHKLLPDGTLFVGHGTEDDYTNMIRQLKTYVFPGGINATIPSGPGLIYSSDDYNINGHGIMVTSTMVLNNNVSNVKAFKHRAVPGGFGTMIATYLAKTPTHWAELYATDDAGTYAAMFMIADMRAAYNAQLSNTTLPAGTLVVQEAIPTSAHFEDMTWRLVRDGVWLSFDIAYFNITRRLTNTSNTFRGGLFSYENSTYVSGPRRDMHFVTNATTMFYAMRHNNFPHDPTQTVPECEHNPKCRDIDRSAMFGAAPRGDLTPWASGFPPSLDGAIDAKVTSPAMLFADPSRPVIIMQNGPTFVQQEPFSFRSYMVNAGETVITRGLPDTWDFPPALLTPHAQLSLDRSSGPAASTASVATIAVVVTLALAGLAAGGFVVRERRRQQRRDAREVLGEASQLL